MRRGVMVVLVGLVGLGCAPSLSTMQPAHVPPKGHVSVTAGFEAGASVSAIETLVDTAKDLARQGQMGQPLTDDDKWRIFDAGVNVLMDTPTIGPLFAVAYTPVNRLELGVRYAGAAWRLGARYQVLDRATGPFDMTVALGVSRFAYEFPLSDQIPGLELKDFSRWQADVGFLIGTRRDFMRVWVGPKALFTKFETELDLTLSGDQTLARFEGQAAFVGGQGGLALGYKHVFLAFELTLAEMFGTAHLTSPALNPPSHDTHLS